MKIDMLEHVNIRSLDIHRLEEWYGRILGLQRGYRPPFAATGIWLYRGEWPMVHLLAVSEDPEHTNPRLEHFAFRATGLESFLDLLTAEDVPYSTVRAPEARMLQVYIEDPDGNTMHLDFPPEEGDALGFA